MNHILFYTSLAKKRTPKQPSPRGQKRGPTNRPLQFLCSVLQGEEPIYAMMFDLCHDARGCQDGFLSVPVIAIQAMAVHPHFDISFSVKLSSDSKSPERNLVCEILPLQCLNLQNDKLQIWIYIFCLNFYVAPLPAVSCSGVHARMKGFGGIGSDIFWGYWLKIFASPSPTLGGSAGGTRGRCPGRGSASGGDAPCDE